MRTVSSSSSGACGSETPIVVDWTAQAAINPLDAEGRATNTLAVEVGSDQVRFLVNGEEVSAQPRPTSTRTASPDARDPPADVQIEDLKLGM